MIFFFKKSFLYVSTRSWRHHTKINKVYLRNRELLCKSHSNSLRRCTVGFYHRFCYLFKFLVTFSLLPYFKKWQLNVVLSWLNILCEIFCFLSDMLHNYAYVWIYVKIIWYKVLYIFYINNRLVICINYCSNS